MPAVNLTCAAPYLQSSADTARMAANMLAYLDAAIGKANETPPDAMGLYALFNPDAARNEHPVSTWFGNLETTQKAELLRNLAAIRKMLLLCQSDLRAAVKGSVKLVPGANNSTYGQTYFAQVRGLAWANRVRPVYSIELGKLHFSSPFGEKVATVFHELSHRICGTIDVVEGGITQYGTANCQQLAAHSPEQALRNADNYGYFVAACTRTLALDIRPS